jgi:hypothetical protein
MTHYPSDKEPAMPIKRPYKQHTTPKWREIVCSEAICPYCSHHCEWEMPAEIGDTRHCQSIKCGKKFELGDKEE